MWLTTTYHKNFQQAYKTQGKILEVTGKHHNLEIFDTQDFGEIALIDGIAISKDFLSFESEFLAHIAACSHKEPKKVLIIGSLNTQIAHEFLRYPEIKVDFFQTEDKLLSSLSSLLPNYETTLKHPNFIHLSQEDSLDSYYDIIISLETSKDYHCYYPLLSEDGILIIKSPHLLLEKDKVTNILKKVGENFRIIMPFYAPLFLSPDCYIFCSKKYHPIADIQLQKADMLEGLNYYHANLHLSAFVLPKVLKQTFLWSAKN